MPVLREEIQRVGISGQRATIKTRTAGSMLGAGLVIVAILVGLVALAYTLEIRSGIVKHSPPCAPIRNETVVMVFAFGGFGAAAGIGSFFALRPRKAWLTLALSSLLPNAATLSIWTYWIVNETLLPYHDFCRKVGMP